MKIWILKAAVQKTISALPYKNRLNYIFQKHVTKRVQLTDELFEDKLIHCATHVAAFEKYATTEKDSALEIGTGWYPIVPIGLYLTGFSNIVSIDISPLVSRESVIAAVDRYSEYNRSGKLSVFLSKVDKTRLEKARELASGRLSAFELMKEMGIRLVIGDAGLRNFRDDSFCLIHSNNTLEHINPQALRQIFEDFKRILHPNGIMSHNIDMSDHFAHLDQSITSFNFLKFSDRQWRLIDNSIQPQNRLRISDFERLLVASGFELLDRKDRVGAEEHLRSVKLAAKYMSYPEKDLLVTHTQLVSRKKNAA